MIVANENCFVLQTRKTTYAFSVMDTGHLEHLYYGRKITLADKMQAMPLVEKHSFAPGNTTQYDKEHPAFSLEDVMLEVSSYGKGDIREPFLEIVHADGSRTSDFLFEKAEVLKGKEPFETLPGSYDEKDEVSHLVVTLRDKQKSTRLELHYYVYEECDVITRSAKLINDSEQEIRVERLLSMQLDFDQADYVASLFQGAWGREMKRTDMPLGVGKLVSSSYAGTSSSRANPFFMLGKGSTSEEYGDCFGFNLIYSGNHYEDLEVSSFGKLRIVSGMNPQGFAYMVGPGESLEAPEAVMTFSHEGYNGMSQNMHDFVREHIVRGTWKRKVRPVLLNSWEAAYFDINEKKLLNLAKAGKEVGIELFVMDDGWFGERDEDDKSLGDWDANVKKLPDGLAGLSAKIKALGMDFGIWVEPEMVNISSKLYKQHPDWTLEIPGQPHSEGRNQRILDLGREEVQQFIIEKMSQVFTSGSVSYVKWDMNRIFSDYYSQSLPADKQGEVAHRYIVGLYRCMDELVKRFPDILFEGCSAGGNRFDLGILCYFPQIWASDDTDAICRAEIQNGYSYGYPMSTVSAHVSNVPNHQTLRITPLETRFAVASFGVLGYECNLCDMSREELSEIKLQIELYKNWREVMQSGRFYRGRSFSVKGAHTGSVLARDAGNITEWTVVSKDQSKAVGMLLQKLVIPNTQYECYHAKGLEVSKQYHFYNLEQKYNVKNFGDLVNTVSPIHIKQNSLAHNLVAKFVKMDGEQEDYTIYGDTLMHAGVKLKQSYGGTGYNEEVRYFQDFGSRMYFMEEI